MKKINLLLPMVLFLLTAVINPESSVGQSKKDSAKIAKIKELVTSQTYTFKAQSAMPMSARTRQLTSEYDLKITKDIITSYLPYFGRAYSAPIGSTDIGLEFTSKDFEYTSADRKKGGWDITIKLKDAKDVTQMQLTIFDNGTTTLQVLSNNRQPISFNGYITSPAKKK
ncbi:MAG: DUF4251 domain-containing protein [Bacteroidota bacterium]